MPILAKLQRQRRLALPKEVADHLGVGEGDVLLFELAPARRVVVIAADVVPRTGGEGSGS